MLGSTDALNGDDLTVFGDILHFLVAAPAQLAVEYDATCATDTDAAAHLGSGKTHTPDHGCQGVLLGVAYHRAVNAVNGQMNALIACGLVAHIVSSFRQFFYMCHSAHCAV